MLVDRAGIAVTFQARVDEVAVARHVNTTPEYKHMSHVIVAYLPTAVPLQCVVIHGKLHQMLDIQCHRCM